MTNHVSSKLLYELSSACSQTECEVCESVECASWETRPSNFMAKNYEILGTCQFDGSENIWDEYHPQQTTIWSNKAPIALKHYPYNRADVLRCAHCQKVYLTYTEFGGYYVDQRIRLVNPDLIVLEE
ncbi:hypothetical protein [Polynucleobacter kasalickyi]|nr:hypothetical protein [Polynucleobacter kasalickyi]